MYNVSQAFKNAIKQPSRMISAKIEIEDRTYFDEHIIDLSYEDTSNPSTNFEIGSTASATINLSLMGVNEVFETLSIKPFIGLDVNGAVEYVPLGVFYADQVERKKNVVSLTLFDGMIKLEQAYFSNLTYPTTIMNVMNEICNKVGIQFSGTLPNYEIMIKPEGYTYREMVGYIAQLCGGFAKFNRDGKLTIKSYAAVLDTYNSDHYIDYNKKKDRPYRIDKLSVQVGENILSKGTLSAGGSEVRFENPFMTDAILTDVFNKLNGFTYLPTWVKLQGNPALECGDIVTLTTIDSEIIQIPIMKHKLSYQGGLIGEIESEGESENQNTFSSSGSMSRKVERVVYEQALINEALINKANIDDLEATNARIDNIYTNDLTAVNASIDNLSARTGTIETLLAGNLTADNFMAGAIIAGSGIIAEGAIGDAEISNLNAAKINAGILNAALVTIQGPNGHLKLSGNRLQVFANRADNSLYERVSLGDVNGDGSVYGFRVRGADGQTVLVDENGVTNEGITDGAVTNEKIAGNANIDGSKINIVSVVTKINEGTTTILGSKVYLDGNTLDIQFSSLKNTVTSQGETITQQSAQISVLNNEISSKVSTTTYQQDMTTINNSLDSITTRLGQAETEIQQTSSQIALKANATDVYTKNQIDGQLSNVNTQISSLSSQLSVQADEIALRVTRNEFDSLQIGGRNLLKNSKSKQDFTNLSNASKSIITNEGDKFTRITTTSSNGYAYVWVGEKIVELNQEYIISMDIRTSTTGNIRLGLRNNTSDGAHEIFYPYRPNPSNGNWVRVSETFKFTKDYTDILILVGLSASGHSIDVKNIKIEVGNKATDWSPAPEDVDGAISGINSRLSTAESTITQHSNEINLRVKTSDFTGNTIASLINQTATTIKIQASKINLVGAVTVLSDITGNLGTITAGTIRGIEIDGAYIHSRADGYDAAFGNSTNTIAFKDAELVSTSTSKIDPTLSKSVKISSTSLFFSAKSTNGERPTGIIQSFVPVSGESIPSTQPVSLIIQANENLELLASKTLTIGTINSGSSVVIKNEYGPVNISNVEKLSFRNASAVEFDQYGNIIAKSTTSSGAIWHLDNVSGTRLIEVPIGSSGGAIKINRELDLGTTNDLKAQDVLANSLEVHAAAGGYNLYLRPNPSGEVRVTAAGGNTTYRPIRSSNFITDTSVRENKKDIEVFGESALEGIRNAKIYTYRRKTDSPDAFKQLGLMVDETPRILHGEAGDSFDLYALSAYTIKGVKELDSKFMSLEDEVNWLKTENQYLKQKVLFLENRIQDLEAKIA